MPKDHLASAFLAALTYLESREVPDDIADDDVRTLETVIYHMRQCDQAERDRISSAARDAMLETYNPRLIESLESIIENLEP